LEKETKLTTNYTKRPLKTPDDLKIPNGHNIYKILHSKAFKSIPKIGIFGMKNIPSGNPGVVNAP
jgi:hypothetical protein